MATEPIKTIEERYREWHNQQSFNPKYSIDINPKFRGFIEELIRENKRQAKQIDEKDKRIEELKDEAGRLSIDIAYLQRFKDEYEEEIESLNEQIKHAIVPKFKIGQEVWWQDSFGNGQREIVLKIQCSAKTTQYRFVDDYDEEWWPEVRLFESREAAEASRNRFAK